MNFLGLNNPNEYEFFKVKQPTTDNAVKIIRKIYEELSLHNGMQPRKESIPTFSHLNR